MTDLATRESLLLCTGEHPVLQLGLHDDNIWLATTDSSVHRWPAEGRNPQKVFQRGGSFLAGNLSFSRARVSLEGSTPVSKSFFRLFCNCCCRMRLILSEKSWFSSCIHQFTYWVCHCWVDLHLICINCGQSILIVLYLPVDDVYLYFFPLLAWCIHFSYQLLTICHLHRFLFIKNQTFPFLEFRESCSMKF